MMYYVFQKTSKRLALKAFQQPLEEVFMSVPSATVPSGAQVPVASTTPAAPAAANTPAPAANTQAAAGVANAPTTLNSAAPDANTAPANNNAATPSFCSRAGTWIYSTYRSVVDFFCSMLAKLPLVGHYFAAAPANQTPAAPAGTTATTTPATGAQVDPNVALVQRFLDTFVPAGSANAAAAQIPDAATVQQLLAVFAQITTAVGKFTALDAVLKAQNVNVGIATDFCNALPADLKDQLKQQIRTVNNDANAAADFADAQISTNPLGNLCKTAAQNCLAAATQAAQTPAAPATGSTTPATPTTQQNP